MDDEIASFSLRWALRSGTVLPSQSATRPGLGAVSRDMFPRCDMLGRRNKQGRCPPAEGDRRAERGGCKSFVRREKAGRTQVLQRGHEEPPRREKIPVGTLEPGSFFPFDFAPRKTGQPHPELSRFLPACRRRLCYLALVPAAPPTSRVSARGSSPSTPRSSRRGWWGQGKRFRSSGSRCAAARCCRGPRGSARLRGAT